MVVSLIPINQSITQAERSLCMTIPDRNKPRSASHHVLIQVNDTPRNIRRSFTMEKMETMGKRGRAT